jgi:uncharacterized protein YkwD
LLTVSSGDTGQAARQAQRPDLAQAAKLVVEKTNEFRQKEGRPKVEINAKLAAAAQYFADFMARTGKYGHEADGKQPAERVKEHEYDYCLIAENIALQFRSGGFTTEGLADQLLQGWKDSPDHRKNMLDPDMTEIGVAVARSEETGRYYAVQLFGRPKSASIRFEVDNQSGVPVEYELEGRTFSLPPRFTRTHEQCRPAELKFRWPDEAKQPGTTVRPNAGDKLAIVRQPSGEFKVMRE